MYRLPRTFVLSVILLSVIAFAQQRSAAPAYVSARPPMQHELYIPYWTLEPGWHTGIELRNNMKNADLTVTPVIRDSDGVEVTLPAVTIKPDDLVVMNLDSELSKASPTIVGRVGSYGSAVLRYSSPFVHNLYGGSMVHLNGKPIAFHFDAIEGNPAFNGGTSRESIWWLPTSTAEGHLVLANASDKSSVSSLSLSDNEGTIVERRISLGPRQTRRFSIRELVTAGGFKANNGGLRIQVERGSESVYAAQVSFDETTGFSALLRMFERNPGDEVQKVVLRAPMLAMRTPDPALLMPEGTVLRPQVFLRNAAPNPLTISAALHWHSDKDAGHTDLGTFEMAAGESDTLDIAKLQDDGRVPPNASWATVTLSYEGRYGDIVAIAASYETEGRYGLQTPFNDAVASAWVGS